MSGTDYVLTPNLGLYKPLPTADTDAWGGHLNSNADMLDAALHSVQTGGPFLSLAGGTMGGAITLAADPVNAMHSSTKQYVDATISRAGGPFLPLTGGTVTGATTFQSNLTLTNAAPTGVNTLLALNQPNLANGQYGLLRIGVDANTSFKSGYIGWMPNATANLSQMVLGVRGYPADIIVMNGTGNMTVNAPTIQQNSSIAAASIGASGGLGWKQVVSVTGSSTQPAWIGFNQWNVNSDTAAITGPKLWHTALNYNFGGAGFSGNRGGFWVNMVQTGPVGGSSGSGGINCLATGVTINNTMGGTDPGPGALGAVFGGNINMNFANGTLNVQGGTGLEIDLSAFSGAIYQGANALSLVTTTQHAQTSVMRSNNGLMIAGQANSIGFDNGILVSSWGLQAGSTLMLADWTADNGTSNFPVSRGFDLRPMSFSNDAIATAGFAVGPTGRVRVGTGYFDVLAGGVSLDAAGAVCTAGTLTAPVTTTYAADGNHYWCDDPYGGIWSVTFASGTTSITAISLVVAGTVKGAPPANPITLTPRGRLHIFVPGTITANLTWDSTRRLLSLNPTGQQVLTNLSAAATDAAAATAGVPIGGLYNNAGVVHVRLT